MDITITINCDNAAFEDDAHGEVASILLEWIESGELSNRKLRDANGNTVGSVEITHA